MLLETLIVATMAVGADDLKCAQTHQLPGFPADSAVFVIDGKPLGRAEALAVVPTRDHVFRVEVGCWNPDTDEFNPRLGGVPLMLMVSTEARAAAGARLEAVAQRVRAHADATGALPSSLRELGEDAEGFSLTILETGWSLVAVDDAPLLCALTQHDDGSDDPVKCSINYDLVGSELRAIYDRGLGLSN